jgi:hypothetical protein
LDGNVKLSNFIFILFIFSSIISCREDKILFPEEPADASIYINSNPIGASIFHRNEFTNKITPGWFLELSPGSHLFTLKYEGFSDTSVYVEVVSTQTKYLTIQMRKEE